MVGGYEESPEPLWLWEARWDVGARVGGTVLTQQAGTSMVLLLNLQYDVGAAFCQGRVPGG